MFSSIIEELKEMELERETSRLSKLLVGELCERVKMILETDRRLPLTSGAKMRCSTPLEFVLTAYLNPRYLSAIEKCYRYTERVIIAELLRVYREHFNANLDDTAAYSHLEMFSNTNEGTVYFGVDAWASKYIEAESDIGKKEALSAS